MITYQEALSMVFARLQSLPAVEVPLEQATGLVLAEAVNARWDMPPADNSAMDGFALAWAPQGTSSEWTVAGSVYAGEPWPTPLESGTVVRIMTGAPLPPGSDTVVPFEEAVEAGATVRLTKMKQGQHVRRQGEEFQTGERLQLFLEHLQVHVHGVQRIPDLVREA